MSKKNETFKKVYVIRKYVIASTLLDASQKEKKQPPDDIYLLNPNVITDKLEESISEKKGLGFK